MPRPHIHAVCYMGTNRYSIETWSLRRENTHSRLIEIWVDFRDILLFLDIVL